MHELKRALKEKGIQHKNTDKKPDLIKMLRTGKTIHIPKEPTRAPRLEDQKKPKSLPVLPKEIMGELDEMAKQGLEWRIDEGDCCVYFRRDLTACANLDQPANNILRTAKAAFGKARPTEFGRKDKVPFAWAE